MGFNRIIDRKFDGLNPRTQKRELITGEVSLKAAAYLVIGSGLLFILSSFAIGTHCGKLSPLVLAFLFFYSFSKRFTSSAHLVLGLGLAMAPGGAWWVLRPVVETTPLILMGSVALWVAGFDIIYACQDEEFDRNTGLHSLPARFGIGNALRLSRLFLFLALFGFVCIGISEHLPAVYFPGLLPIAGMFIHQHRLVSADDLSKVNRAFFTANGWVSFYYLVLIAVVTAV